MHQIAEYLQALGQAGHGNNVNLNAARRADAVWSFLEPHERMLAYNILELTGIQVWRTR